MGTRIVINDQEVTNPVVKAVIRIAAVLLSVLIAALVIFLVLPLVGIAVTLSVGLVGVILIALGIGIPLFILGGSVIGLLLTPIAAIRESLKVRKTR